MLSPLFWLSLLCTQTVVLQGVFKNSVWESAQVGEQGELLAVCPEAVYHWSADGTLLRKLAPPSQSRIVSAFFDGKRYLLSSVKLETVLYSQDGNLIATNRQRSDYIFKFYPCDDRFFCLPLKTNDDLTLEPYLFQVYDCSMNFEGNAFSITTNPAFGKIQPIQANMQYNLLDLWLARKGDSFLLVNQLEAKVFIYTQAEIRRERQDGTKKPTEIKAAALSLPFYVKPPDSNFSISKPMKKNLYEESRRRWRNSWSRITWFGRYKDGYAISYEVPESVPTDNTNNLVRNMAIQCLDADLKPSGKPLLSKGMMMGASQDGHFYVLQTENTQLQVQILP